MWYLYVILGVEIVAYWAVTLVVNKEFDKGEKTVKNHRKSSNRTPLLWAFLGLCGVGMAVWGVTLTGGSEGSEKGSESVPGVNEYSEEYDTFTAEFDAMSPQDREFGCAFMADLTSDQMGLMQVDDQYANVPSDIYLSWVEEACR